MQYYMQVGSGCWVGMPFGPSSWPGCGPALHMAGHDLCNCAHHPPSGLPNHESMNMHDLRMTRACLTMGSMEEATQGTHMVSADGRQHMCALRFAREPLS